MRSFGFLLMAVIFAVAVILPNEIGTHDLPAVGCKIVAKVTGKVAEQPANGSLVAHLASFEPLREPAVGNFESAAGHRMRTAGNGQINLPLLT